MRPGTLQRLLVIGICAGLLLGCGRKRGHHGRRKDKRIFTVHVKRVAERVLSTDIVATGTSQPYREVQIATQVSGTLVTLNIALGRLVKKGRLLARVSTVGLYGQSRQAAADIQRYKADIAQAKQELKDTRTLHEQKIASRKQLDDAQHKLASLQAQMARSQAVLAQVGEQYRGGAVYAPFSGIIASQNVELGDYVSPGKVLGQLVDLSAVKVVVGLAEPDMVRITGKTPVRVRFPSLGKESWPAHIEAVAPTADAKTGAFPVEIVVKNPDGRLRGGMAAHVVFRGRGIRGIFVPVEAVVERGGRQVAYVIVKGKAPAPMPAGRRGSMGPRWQGLTVSQRRCTLGRTRDGMVQVTNGLKVGDQLVVAGNTRLRDGSRVRIASAGGMRKQIVAGDGMKAASMTAAAQ